MAADLPPNSLLYLPVLIQKQKELWPNAPYPSTLAAQIDKETCPSPKHKSCWNPRAELKTSREYGFGLGQITITNQFNNFSYAKSLTVNLRNWDYADRYNAAMQIEALVVWNKVMFDRVKGAKTVFGQLAMSKAAYNGGEGGLNSDRRVCLATPGCDQTIWFGHVERTSLKAKLPKAGYGESFFQINRRYVKEIMYDRRAKYERYF